MLTACFASAAGCRDGGKSDAPAVAAAPVALPPAAPPGQARRIDITVDDKGYHPPAAPARAGEKLVLAFTRTADSECVRQVIVDGKTTELPLNKPVEIATTMPASGDLVFTCGMKMYEGRVAVATK
jgi:plastocyanin domain-containing protein